MHNLQSDSVWRRPLGSNARWAPKSKLVSSEEEETKALSGYVKMQGEERWPSPREPTGQCEKCNYFCCLIYPVYGIL